MISGGEENQTEPEEISDDDIASFDEEGCRIEDDSEDYDDTGESYEDDDCDVDKEDPLIVVCPTCEGSGQMTSDGMVCAQCDGLGHL